MRVGMIPILARSPGGHVAQWDPQNRPIHPPRDPNRMNLLQPPLERPPMDSGDTPIPMERFTWDADALTVLANKAGINRIRIQRDPYPRNPRVAYTPLGRLIMMPDDATKLPTGFAQELGDDVLAQPDRDAADVVGDCMSTQEADGNLAWSVWTTGHSEYGNLAMLLLPEKPGEARPPEGSTLVGLYAVGPDENMDKDAASNYLTGEFVEFNAFLQQESFIAVDEDAVLGGWQATFTLHSYTWDETAEWCRKRMDAAPNGDWVRLDRRNGSSEWVKQDADAGEPEAVE